VPQAKEPLLWGSHFRLAPVPHGVMPSPARRPLLGSRAHEFCPIGMSRDAVGCQVIDLLKGGGHGLAMLLFASSSKSSFQFAERNERHRQYKKNSPGLLLLRSQISRIAAGPPKGLRTCQSVVASDHTRIGMPRNARVHAAVRSHRRYDLPQGEWGKWLEAISSGVTQNRPTRMRPGTLISA
jgi:hypothetical protein